MTRQDLVNQFKAIDGEGVDFFVSQGVDLFGNEFVGVSERGKDGYSFEASLVNGDWNITIRGGGLFKNMEAEISQCKSISIKEAIK